MEDDWQIDKALKMMKVLCEPEEANYPCPSLEGLKLEELLNLYQQYAVNKYLNDLQVEVVTSLGTIFCQLTNNICTDARFFPNEDDISQLPTPLDEISPKDYGFSEVYGKKLKYTN